MPDIALLLAVASLRIVFSDGSYCDLDGVFPPLAPVALASFAGFYHCTDASGVEVERALFTFSRPLK